MKLIKAYVRPVMVDQVIHALEKIQASCMTAVDVRTIGKEVNENECSISVEYGTTYNEIIKLEIICDDNNVTSIVGVIEENARTGKKGDGLIAISPVEEVIKIRTGDQM